MASFSINTTKVANDGKNIKDIAGRYKQNMSDLFESLRTLPTNNIWIGTEGNSSVYTFLDRVLKEKDQYMDAADYIGSYGSLIESLANKIDGVVENKIK